MKKVTLNKLKVPMTLIIAAMVGLTACKKDKDDPKPQNQTIVDIVVGNSDFSLLKTAVIHADLQATLASAGPFTVFAPNNAAFAAAGLDTDAKIKALPAATVKNILLYHVLGQSVTASAIKTGSNAAVETVAKQNIFITKNTSGVFVNGAMVTKADIMAKNGVIHVINTVLMPASGNIVASAQANANLSLLVAAVLRASQGTTNVAEVLSGTGPFTVFAPTNQAFINAGFKTVADINAANPNTLAAILTYHVISGRIFSSDLVNASMPATVNGGKVTISLPGGAKVKGTTNSTAATISPANMVATNGVIHIIDQVLTQ